VITEQQIRENNPDLKKGFIKAFKGKQTVVAV